MSRKTALIILYLVLLFIVGAFVAQVILERAVTSEILVRTIIPLGLCAGAIAKVRTGTGGRLRRKLFYESEYQDELRTAFAEPERKHLRGRLLRAIQLYNGNKLDRAAKELQKLLPYCRTTDDFYAVLLFLALVYTDMQLPELATQTYYELLRHEQRRSTAWSNLGLLLRDQGHNRDAIGCFANALKCDSNNATAYHNLAATFFYAGRYEEAITYANTALKLKSNFRNPADLLCMIYYLQQDEANCKKYFTLAITNGSKPADLKEALEALRDRGLPSEFSFPLTQEIRLALRHFYIRTAQTFAWIGIPADPADGRTNSRLGGPSAGEAPLDSSGQPMRLLCLIDCSEVPGVPDFPTAGILRFYIADNASYGADLQAPNVQKDFRVLYTPDSGPLPEGAEPAPSGTFPVKGRYPILFGLDLDGMTDSDYRFLPLLNQELQAQGLPAFEEQPMNVQEAICDRCHSEGHRLGGYPHFAQTDPRNAREEYRRYDTLLLQLDSHVSDNGAVRIMIGDHGVMQFFIPREKLQARDFSDILYTWDCADTK